MEEFRPRRSSAVQQINLSLIQFQYENFDCHTFIRTKCQPQSEKEVRRLHTELLKLKKRSSEEMRMNALSNYVAFMRTLHKIAGLEGSLLSMQSLLSCKAAVICDLKKYGPLPCGIGMDCLRSRCVDDHRSSQLKRSFQRILDTLDVLLVDQKVKEAVKVLDQGRRMLSEASSKDILLHDTRDLQIALVERRGELVEQLIGTTRQLGVHGADLRTAISALDQIGDGSRAHALLLDSHDRKISYGMKNLRPCGTLYGGLYTAALSQSVFSGILQAAKDMVAIFGDHTEHASKMVVWAYKETEGFVALLKKHVLLVAGGLHAAVECVRIAYGHCLLLESQGLALCPFLCKALRPTIMGILHGNLEHIKEAVASVTAADTWALVHVAASRQGSRKVFCRSSGRKLKNLCEFPPKLSISAHHLDTLAQDFASDTAPLLRMHMGESLLDGLTWLFSSYIGLLLKAMPGCSTEDNSVKKGHNNPQVNCAERIDQQIAILGNAALLAEDLFPRAALMALTGGQSSCREQLRLPSVQFQDLGDWESHLKQAVMKLQSHFSKNQQEYFLNNCYCKMSSEVYSSFHQSLEDHFAQSKGWMPSPFYEELFLNLNEIKKVAEKLLPARHQVVLLPLMKIIKGVLLELKNNDSFWKAIEDCRRSLRPEGCVQFVFDLHFVMQFSSNGGYSSRSLREVVSDLICHVQNIYAENGCDPQSL